MEQFIFWFAAVVSLVSAFIVVVAPNTVHSALALVLNFFMLAVFYVLLEAQFLAAAQVIVYAGAIMVLFLFVIMLLGVDREETIVEPIRYQRLIAAPLAIAFVGIAVFTVRGALQSVTFTGLSDANHAGNVQGLGRLLFTRYLFPFEVTSLLLIIAAIGAMVIAKRRSADQMLEEEEDA
ncbi:MAG: NADH-quinone oxidoreductase subunit J [Actinomycetota bacterium]